MRSETKLYVVAAIAALTASEVASAFQLQGFPRNRSTKQSQSTSSLPTTINDSFSNRRPPSITSRQMVVMVEDAEVTASALDTFFQTQPYLAAFLTCSIKAGTADLLAQTRRTSPEPEPQSSSQDTVVPFDISRNLSFVFYGGLVQGMFQQFLFTVIYPIMFGHDHTLFTTLQQVAFDVGVMPFVYLPIVYSMKSLFSSSGDLSVESVKIGLAKLMDDITNKDLLKTYWSIWIPAQCLTFGVVPAHLRVLFVALVSFCWVTILSSISSSAPSTTSTTAAGVVEQPPRRFAAPTNLPGVVPAAVTTQAFLKDLQRRVVSSSNPSDMPTIQHRPAYVTIGVSGSSSNPQNYTAR